MIVLVFILIFENLIFGVIAIKKTIYLKRLRSSKDAKIRKIVPKLSGLHGKEFTSYMLELNKHLY